MNGNNCTNNQHRIFVSYSNRDNVKIGKNKTQWVTNLIIETRKLLERQINVKIITADHITKSGVQKERISDEVEKSSILIPIISKAFLDSKRCLEVIENFKNKYKFDSESRIIPVEMDKISDNNPFEAITRNRFWFEDTITQTTRTLCLNTSSEDEENKYSLEIEGLKNTICETLSDLENQIINKDITTVFLAEPTDRLFDQYKEVKTHLKNIGFSVLPENRHKSKYEEDPDSVLEKLKKDILRSNFFVQFIESNFCKSIEKMNYIDKYLTLQYELAKHFINHRFLWIPQEFNSDKERKKIESNHWTKDEDNLHFIDMDNFKEILNQLLKPHIEKPESDDDMPTDLGQHGGFMLASGNISKSEINEKIKTLMTGFKSVHKFYVEYKDNSSHSNFLFYHQDSLSQKSALQPFHLSNNNPIPLKLRK